MYDYVKLIKAEQSGLLALTDPSLTIPGIPTDDNPTPDPIPDPTPILFACEYGIPKKIEFWNKVGAILLFGNVATSDYMGINKQRLTQVIQGAVITFVPGDDPSAMERCLHYSDIIGDYFEKKSALGIPGVTHELMNSNSQGWKTIDLRKFLDIDTKQLDMITTATTTFQIYAPKLGDVRPRF